MKSIFLINSTKDSSFSIVVFFISILIVISITSTDTWALNHHVTSAAELHAALSTAQNNANDDIIKIARGTYIGNFSYVNDDGFSISVEGGYDTMFCFREVDPKNTTLDGGNSGRVLHLYNTAGGDITVDGLTVKNGSGTYGAGINARSDKLSGDVGAISLIHNIISGNNATGGDYYGGGVHIYSKANNGTSADITITDNVITGNTVERFGGGVYASTLSYPAGNSGEITITNNVFAGNTATVYDSGGMDINSSVDTASYTCGNVYVCNNTFVDNTAGRYGGGFGLSSNNGIVRVYNNITWNNSATVNGNDIHLFSSDGATFYGYYNDYSDLFGVSWTNSGNNINEDPLFVNAANGNYHLKGNSPCINAGIFGKKTYIPLPTDMWVVTNYSYIPADDFEEDSRDSDWIEVTTNNYYKYCDMGADEYTHSGMPYIPLLLLAN